MKPFPAALCLAAAAFGCRPSGSPADREILSREQAAGVIFRNSPDFFDSIRVVSVTRIQPGLCRVVYHPHPKIGAPEWVMRAYGGDETSIADLRRDAVGWHVESTNAPSQ